MATDPRPLLDDDHKTDHVRREIASFHADIVAQVAQAVSSQPVVIVGMTVNPFVKRARKALTAAGIEFTYLEYGGYTSQWKQRLAIKLWSGWQTFPQVFVNGTLIGGNQELQGMLADGSLAKQLGR